MIKRKQIFLIQLLLIFLGTVISAKPLSKTIVWKYYEWRDWIYRWDSIAKADSLQPVVWMEIPEIELSTFIVADDTEKNLEKYPCLAEGQHLKESGLNIILGHRDMQFFKLKDLKDEHRIMFEFKDKSRKTYRIIETEVIAKDRTERRLADNQNKDMLVLMTCHPFLFLGSAPDRFLVWAELAE